MATLRIELSKTSDGNSILKCVRADGSVAWQRNAGLRAHFFPLHDLTHYAVETVLGAREGFYGLIADGWEIEDTTGNGTRGALSDLTVTIEHLVGLLDAERTSGATIGAAEMNGYTAAFAKRQGRAGLHVLTEEVLQQIRSEAARLQAEWRELAPGRPMTLMFSPTAPKSNC